MNSYAMVVAAVVLWCPIVRAQQAMPPRLVDFLQQRIGFGPAQVAAVERGEVPVKILAGNQPRDVAIFGIAVVNVPRTFLVNLLADAATIGNNPSVTGFGIFHDPPVAADVKDVAVAPEDLPELKTCRPGNCKLKMPAGDMKQLAALAGQGGDVQARMDAYTRNRLLEFAANYRRRGDAAMVVYDDAGGVRSSDAFDALLAQSPYVYSDLPSLRNYLAAYPRSRPDGVRERLFWSATSVSGLRPSLTVNHMLWYSPPELPSTTLIAVKQIYANHYFEGAFSLTAAMDRSASDTYLVVLHRLRLDKLPDGPMRNRVIGRMRDAFRDQLVNQKRMAERAHGRTNRDGKPEDL